jgi:hypothetical protein
MSTSGPGAFPKGRELLPNAVEDVPLGVQLGEALAARETGRVSARLSTFEQDDVRFQRRIAARHDLAPQGDDVVQGAARRWWAWLRRTVRQVWLAERAGPRER